MAINTDAAFGQSALYGQREAANSHPADFQDTEKLLSASAADAQPSDGSFCLSLRGSVRSLDAHQDGHRSPLKSGSVGQLSAAPKSPSRLSLGPLPSPVPPGSEPPSYLWLAVMSCFCPGIPLNMYALWYAHVSRSVLHTGDIEGARKYGRLSMLFSCISLLLAVAFIIFIVVTIEYR